VTATLLDISRYDPDDDVEEDTTDGIDAGDLAELDARIGRVGRCVDALDPDPLSRMDPTESIPRQLRHAGRRM